MKTFCKAFALSALLGTVRSSNEADRSLEVKQSGANCNVSVGVTCKLKGGNLAGEDCAILKDQPCSTLTEDRNLEFTYTYCNQNEDGVVLTDSKTTPRLHSRDIFGFDKTTMGKKECRVVLREKSFNTCEVGSTAAGMKLEGWVKGKVLVDSYYCYGYDHLKVFLRETDVTTFVTPTSPSISLMITSEFETVDGSGIYVSTDVLGSYVADTQFDCDKKFKFTYSVTSGNPEEPEEFEKVTLAALIGNVDDDLLSGHQDDLDFVKNTYEVVKYEIINTCQKSGTEIVTQATAVATGFPDLLPGSGSSEDQFLIPNISPKIAAGSAPEIECLYKGQDCATYATLNGCFTDQVDFKYKVKKTDVGCHHVDQVYIVFNNDDGRLMSLDDEHSCNSREFCYGQTWVLEETRFLDVCAYSDQDFVPINIECTFSTPDSRPTEDNVDFRWDPPVEAQIDDPTKPPTAEDSTSALDDLGTVCDKRADKLYFQYTGESCPDSRRKLRSNKKNEATCEETGTFSGSSKRIEIEINGDMIGGDTNPRSFNPSDIILVTGGPTNMEVVVTASSGGTQEFSLHSSCSGDFKIGDKFGSFQLIGFVNDSQGAKGSVSTKVAEIDAD